VAITPDGRQAVSGAWDETLKVWDLASGAVVATFTADAPLFACAAPLTAAPSWPGIAGAGSTS